MYTPDSILLFYLFKVSIITSKHVKALFWTYCGFLRMWSFRLLKRQVIRCDCQGTLTVFQMQTPGDSFSIWIFFTPNSCQCHTHSFFGLPVHISTVYLSGIGPLNCVRAPLWFRMLSELFVEFRVSRLL